MGSSPDVLRAPFFLVAYCIIRSRQLSARKKKFPWYEASKRFVAQLAAVPVVGGRFGGACERGWNASNKRLVLRLIKGCLRPLLCDEE